MRVLIQQIQELRTGLILVTKGIIHLNPVKLKQQRIVGSRRITYQIPENGTIAIGRSFEEALILANCRKFGVTGDTVPLREQSSKDLAPDNKEKTTFALKYALEDNNWQAPAYIVEGLQWLATNPITTATELVVVNEPGE